jgi:hypothetical protein
MTSEFEKDFLPEWCENCDQQGVFFIDNIFEPYLVACQHCDKEVISVWCPECEAGFALPIKKGSRQTDWDCPICHKHYFFPEAAYKQPVKLYLESDLPEDVRMRVIPQKRVSNVFTTAMVILAIIAFGILVLALLL